MRTSFQSLFLIVWLFVCLKEKGKQTLFRISGSKGEEKLNKVVKGDGGEGAVLVKGQFADQIRVFEVTEPLGKKDIELLLQFLLGTLKTALSIRDFALGLTEFSLGQLDL